jgi:hypothetical protein
MRADYFVGNKEILPMTRFEIDQNTYCEVSIFQHWDSVYRNDCSCGVEKTRRWMKKTGWSKEYALAVEAEIGFSLSIGLASLSPKIAAKINKSLNISIEKEEEETTKFTAPKCGIHEIAIYQLITEWNIKLFKNKKRLFRKTLPVEFNHPTQYVGESVFTESSNVYEPLPNCNCKDKNEYNGNVTLAINSGVINLPCKRLDNKIEIYGIDKKLFSQGEILKLEELPIEVSKSLHSTSEAKILTFGERMPLFNVIELIAKFEKLILTAKEVLLRYFGKDFKKITSFFEIFVDFFILKIPSYPFQTFKNFLTDDEWKVRTAKQSLDKLRNGDLSEFSKQFNAFHRSFTDADLLSLFDPWIKEEHKEETKAQFLELFKELYSIADEFFQSSKELIIDFIRKAADLLYRLIDANNIQEAILMTKEFVIGSEDQMYEFNNKAKKLLNVVLDK